MGSGQKPEFFTLKTSVFFSRADMLHFLPFLLILTTLSNFFSELKKGVSIAKVSSFMHRRKLACGQWSKT